MTALVAPPEHCDHAGATGSGRLGRSGRPSWPARPLLALIGWYQVARDGRPSPCRFTPSCSTYAAEALRTQGAGRGAVLAAWRLARCHPWGGQGYDPVPEKKAPR
jgi:putative membrane protein insertion efficiency factor